MKREKRTETVRLTFTVAERRVLDAQFEAMYPTTHNLMSEKDRSVYFRQALLAVALAAVRVGEFHFPLAVDLRSKTAQELAAEESIRNGGAPNWIGNWILGPG